MEVPRAFYKGTQFYQTARIDPYYYQKAALWLLFYSILHTVVRQYDPLKKWTYCDRKYSHRRCSYVPE